jgi:hypothetical protein
MKPSQHKNEVDMSERKSKALIAILVVLNIVWFFNYLNYTEQLTYNEIKQKVRVAILSSSKAISNYLED